MGWGQALDGKFPSFNSNYYPSSFSYQSLVMVLMTEHQRAIDYGNAHGRENFEIHRKEYEAGIGLGCGTCSKIDMFIGVDALFAVLTGNQPTRWTF